MESWLKDLRIITVTEQQDGVYLECGYPDCKWYHRIEGQSLTALVETTQVHIIEAQHYGQVIR
jgi:hypothetical protein